MSSTNTIKLAQQLHRIAAKWPVDPFRPNLQLKTFFESLADHPQLTSQAMKATRMLEENEIKKKACLNKILRPASMPKHYERLVEGFEKSAKGIGRPWWKIFFGIW
ncbi:hypothetical protein PHLCEN_2v1712 [Hermanssonia centrifuga]|uniref:Uncharacterized protein n=1 Tax=Hermanssonia centrifuga TaxID=98765 RepID=A0A2R6RW42_9APHY|nr:hypothetical protein PHLCEN_2v1712 [Hermanssonia centrifuga]